MCIICIYIYISYMYMYIYMYTFFKPIIFNYIYICINIFTYIPNWGSG